MERQQVERVRRFNRAVTQRAGALSQDYLSRGRPLGEARLIFEIGPGGAEVRALRERLGLDSGYLSRLLRSLEAQGLVEVSSPECDGRVRVAALTATGRLEFAAYDQRSDDLAASMLAGLDEARRKRLIAAMDEVESLLAASAVTLAFEPAGSPDGVACLAAYFDELDRRFEGGFDRGAGVAAQAAELDASGHFIVARREGVAVACGALVPQADNAGEVKRVWVAPSARGLGIAARLMQALEDKARECGFKVLRLDTNRVLSEAIGLYRRLGFRDIPRFNDNPYAHHWFEKDL